MFGATADDWATRLRAAGVPCEVVREESWLRSVLLDDAMVERGRVNEIEHPLHGRARVIGQLFSLDTHPGVRRGRSPLLGEHTDELLAELGFDDAERESARGRQGRAWPAGEPARRRRDRDGRQTRGFRGGAMRPPASTTSVWPVT